MNIPTAAPVQLTLQSVHRLSNQMRTEN